MVLHVMLPGGCSPHKDLLYGVAGTETIVENMVCGALHGTGNPKPVSGIDEAPMGQFGR